jgi:hypothetical protein
MTSECREVHDHRVLVTGSRYWDDLKTVFDELDRILALVAWEAEIAGVDWTVTVVHGACPSGADRHAAMWYRSRHELWGDHVREDPHPADWDGPLGKGAGFARNQVMADKGAHECVAFFRNGAGNRGTSDCAARAEAARIPVRRFYE